VNLPTAHLAPGDTILLVPLRTSADTANQTTYTATVVDIGVNGSGAILHIAVPAISLRRW